MKYTPNAMIKDSDKVIQEQEMNEDWNISSNDTSPMNIHAIALELCQCDLFELLVQF